MDNCPEHIAHSEHLLRNDKRIGDLEGNERELVKLTTEISVLVKRYDTVLSDQEKRLDALENQPKDNWNTLKNAALAAIGGSIGGAIILALSFADKM